MHCVTCSCFSVGIIGLVTEMTGINLFLLLLLKVEEDDLKQPLPCSESILLPGGNCHHYSKQILVFKLQCDFKNKLFLAVYLLALSIITPLTCIESQKLFVHYLVH